MGRGTSKVGGGSANAGGGAVVPTQGIDLENASATVIDMVINQADSLDELDAIVETIANNEVISNAEYSQLKQKALRKAQSWQPGNKNSSQSTNQRDVQIDNLEQSVWRGNGTAMHPSMLNVGDRIDGIQYEFKPDVLMPTQKKGSWSGDYNGTPMKFSADNTFQVTNVVSSGNSTTVTATKLGGAGGTVKKKLPNDVYLRVFR